MKGLWLLLAMTLSAAAQDARRLDIRLTGGLPDSGERMIQAKAGEALQLWWHSDQALTLSLEKHDLDMAVLPEVPAVMVFQTGKPGRYAVRRQDGQGRNQVLLYLVVLP